MARKTFATTVEEKVAKDFKVACAVEGRNMNFVLEKLMRQYAKEILEKVKPE